MIDLSIIIVTFQSQNEIGDCLRTIYEKFKSFNYEIIIIDNDSKDSTVNIIYEKYPKVKLLQNKINLGFTKANNIAVSKANGKYLLFLNPDIIIIKENVIDMLTFIAKNKNVGVLGPKILNKNHSSQFSCGNQPRLMTSFIEIFHLGTLFKKKIFGYRIDMSKIVDPATVGWVSGAFLLVKKEIFLMIGGFDENIFMYAEDVDLCLRLKKEGYKTIYFPDYSVVHLEGKSSRQNRKLAVISGHNARIYFYNKHFGKFHCNTIRLLLIISSMIKVVVLYLFVKNDDKREKIEAHVAALMKLLSFKHR